MLTDANIQTLKSINSIDALLNFLRHDLAWPIAEGDVSEVTFAYEPEELGLKEEHSPKINCVYQIRPITKDQPWGIFFIDFENKKLPVSLMRRILNHLRVKNRGGSGQWDTGDLLFMTTYGEDVQGMREVAFAHFHQQPGDLPTLNVLQWDAQDTAAKLKTTYENLKSNLGWPETPSNTEAWRTQWRKPFRHKLGHTIKTSSALAEKLAELSKEIRDRCNEILAAENEKGQITKLYKAFQSALIHDLKPEDFADTFAQTIAYGLFTAAVSRRMPEEKGSTSLTTDTISQIVPETSPFLREVLETFIDVSGRKQGIDFDEVGVQDIVELLRSDETDMRAILEDFGNRKPGEDPVIHFYEHYLAAYNKELKVKRGVFYTPQPVVSYIVRSVHELLQTEFGIEDGLASTITWAEMVAKGLPERSKSGDEEPVLSAPQPSLDGLAVQPTLGESIETSEAEQTPKVNIPEGTDPDSPFVVILDPATGTATFLVEVLDVIWRHLQDKWRKDEESCWNLLKNPPRLPSSAIKPTFEQFWNAYVPDHLLPRLYGYEIMMAPYAIAHLKMGLKLAETGYKFGQEKRVRIYLTNALEPAAELQAQLALNWEALAHEAHAVKSVKEAVQFTTVIGNPPYSGVSANMSAHAQRLIEPYKFINNVPLNEKKLWLQDDYVKFIRIAQDTLTKSSLGILGFITNNGYLENPTFRGMRWNLSKSFSQGYFLDLHGNSKKKEISPDGSKDENIFDIQQGVSICLLAMQGLDVFSAYHAEVFGSRKSKYDFMDQRKMENSTWSSISPNSPYFLFAPQDQRNLRDYNLGWSMPVIFPFNSAGFITARDHFVVGFSKAEVLDRLKDFANTNVCDEEIRLKYFAGRGSEKYLDGDTRGWKLPIARRTIQKLEDLSKYIRPCLYRPFDQRQVFWSEAMVDWPRPELASHFAPHSNLAIITARSNKSEWMDHFFITDMIAETKCGESTTQSTIFPLYLHDLPSQKTINTGPRVNISSTYLGIIRSISNSASPEQIQSYIYAILYSPDYRNQYQQFLQLDFPRIPVPGTESLFLGLSELGEQLISLHLLKTALPATQATVMSSPGPFLIQKVEYSNGSVWLDKEKTSGFDNIPVDTWNFTIGGYRVCEKWLKDRSPKKGQPGRVLTLEDIKHYQRIVSAIGETIRVMREIDEVIEAHGGWPGAFISDEGS